MDYQQLLARYEDVLDAILDLELQIWELCWQNSQLRQALDDLNSAEFTTEQQETFTRQNRIGQHWGVT